MKLYVFVPSARDWKPQFASSLLGMMNRLLKLPDFELDINISCAASNLSKVRQIALDEATRREFDYLFTLDDDMTFPPDTVERLLQHDQAFVAANYKRKTALVDGSLAFDLNGVPIDSSYQTGLQEVYFVGAGINLININKIKHIKPPHYCVMWDEKTGYQGEDFYFCQKLRDNQIPVYIDHDVSKTVGHIGDYEFKFTNKVNLENIYQLKKAG